MKEIKKICTKKLKNKVNTFPEGDCQNVTNFSSSDSNYSSKNTTKLIELDKLLNINFGDNNKKDPKTQTILF